ncbi:MAG: oxidative damage protection protein [Neisseriaceae bacterium]|nr:MAG: oxidative damage protection protein [Neisseriaceae bacterium]
MSRIIYCVRLKKEATGLKFPPFPNEIGKRIYENISQEAWDEWTRYQTMLINENRLNLSDATARKYLLQQMENFFFSDNSAGNIL